MLQRAGAPTSAELQLSRMRAKIDDFCPERDEMRARDQLVARDVELGQSEPATVA